MTIALDLISPQNSKVNTSTTSLRLFPASENEENGTIVASNISVIDGELDFDLSIEDINTNEFSSLKLIYLTDTIEQQLTVENFPEALSLKAQQILFSNDKNTVSLVPLPLIEDARVKILQPDEEIYSVLIVLEDFPLVNSDVFLLQVPKSELLVQKTSNENSYSQIFSKSDFQTTSLKIKENDTYVSTLLYSYNDDGVFSGMYCVDLEKMIVDFTKFPNLLFGKPKEAIDNFIYKSEFILYKYDKLNSGYKFADAFNVVAPEPEDNLAVENSSPYRFYGFTMDLNDDVSELQGVLKIHFNDITINFAKQFLNQLKIVRDNGDRVLAAQILFDIYEEDFEEQFNFNLSNILKISNLDYKNLVNKSIEDVSKKINAASQKVVVNTNTKSQYTHPTPSFSDFYINIFEQKFAEKIFLGKKRKVDNLFDIVGGDGPFLSVAAESALDQNALSTLNQKTFPVVRELQKIGGFSQNSKRDILITNKGLQEKVNVSDGDEKALKNLADLPESKFVSFSSQQDRNIKLYYLASVGDTSPVLLFQEVTEDVNILDLLTEDNKILIRLDNYEEFYNSYFYITLN